MSPDGCELGLDVFRIQFFALHLLRPFEDHLVEDFPVINDKPDRIFVDLSSHFQFYGVCGHAGLQNDLIVLHVLEENPFLNFVQIGRVTNHEVLLIE